MESHTTATIRTWCSKHETWSENRRTWTAGESSHNAGAELLNPYDSDCWCIKENK